MRYTVIRPDKPSDRDWRWFNQYNSKAGAQRMANLLNEAFGPGTALAVPVPFAGLGKAERIPNYDDYRKAQTRAAKSVIFRKKYASR